MEQVLLIESIHLLISFYLLLGGYFIPNKYLPVYLLSIPYIIIDWNDKDGLCWLTKLNNMIKYKTLNPEVKEEIENYFIKNTLQKIGIIIESKTLTFTLYVLFLLSWFYAYTRLMKQYKIKLFPNEVTRYTVYSMVIGWLVITYVESI